MSPVTKVQPWLARSDEAETDFLWFRAWLTNAWDKEFKPVSIRAMVITKARSIDKTAAWFAVPSPHVDAISRRFEWVERGRGYDNFVLDRFLGNRMSTLEEHRVAQDTLVSEANEVVQTVLSLFRVSLGDDARAPEAREKLKSMRIDIPKLMDVALHYQGEQHKRTAGADGDATNTEGSGEVWNFDDYTASDYAELRRLRLLAGLDKK